MNRFTHNANNSPLLAKMPAELRNRVYGNLMSGHVIHVSEPQPKRRYPTVSLCVDAEDHHNFPRDCHIFGGLVQLRPDSLTIRSRHQSCYIAQAIYHTLNLNLTLVCRQIHTEVARLPFALNKFVIDYPYKVGSHIFHSFLDHLHPIQVGSIEHLNLHCQVELLEKSEVDLLLRMKGLKSITLIVSNRIRNEIGYSLQGLGFPPHGVVKERLELDRLRLSQLPVKFARVYMEPVVGRRNAETEKWALTIFNNWQRETEKIILGSADEFLAREAKEAEEKDKGSDSMCAWIEQLQDLAFIKNDKTSSI